MSSSARVLFLLRQRVPCSPDNVSAACGPAAALSLAQVARATNVSVGFLSALERGQMRSSIATLRRIARFYRTNILSLFETAGDNPRLVRPNQRKILETTPDVRMELLAWGNTAMEPHLFRIKPGGGSGESYSHEGEEFLHVMRGNLRFGSTRASTMF